MANSFNNNGNGTGQKQLTKNTRGPQLYNSNEDYGSTIALDYWQSFANIRIYPMLPKEYRNPKNMYDYQNGLSVLLTIEKIIELKEAAKYVAGEVANGNYQFRRAGTSTGKGDNIIQFVPVSFVTGNEEDEGIAIQICTGIKEDGTTQNVLNFILGESSFIFDYDPSNGGYEKSENFETQFLVICTYLQNAENALTMAHVHAIELEEMYRNSYVNRSLSELNYKLGISGQSNNYGNNNSGTNFSNHFNQSNSSNNFVAGSNVENGGEISGGDRLTLEDFDN